MTMPSLLTLKILTPESVILDVSEIQAVTIPLGDGGSIGIRPGHAPLIAETHQGVVKYRNETEDMEIALFAGVLDIRDNVITILTAGEDNQQKKGAFYDSDKKYERLLQTLISQLTEEENGLQEE
jgi:F0F1-type ATP synthase epsilon subunit